MLAPLRYSAITSTEYVPSCVQAIMSSRWWLLLWKAQHFSPAPCAVCHAPPSTIAANAAATKSQWGTILGHQLLLLPLSPLAHAKSLMCCQRLQAGQAVATHVCSPPLPLLLLLQSAAHSFNAAAAAAVAASNLLLLSLAQVASLPHVHRLCTVAPKPKPKPQASSSKP